MLAQRHARIQIFLDSDDLLSLCELTVYEQLAKGLTTALTTTVTQQHWRDGLPQFGDWIVRDM